MQITGLEYKKIYFNLYVDGELFCRLNDETIVRLGLKKGMELPEEKADEILEISRNEAALRDGARMLAAAAKAKNDFIRKLMLKGHSREAAEKSASFFEEKGIIDDRKFAESYVNDALKLKKDGKSKIAFSLKKYGIDEEIISEVLADKDDSEGLRALALRELSKNKDINKVKRKLYSKGYGIWDINSVIEELEDEV